jgi:hypothetical protein
MSDESVPLIGMVAVRLCLTPINGSTQTHDNDCGFGYATASVAASNASNTRWMTERMIANQTGKPLFQTGH